jgi:hypothetical protein
MDELRIYDNGGRSFDRFTVFMPDGYVLGIGETGNVPNGFCMTVDAVEGSHLGSRIKLADLSEPVQRAIAGEFKLAEAIRADTT